MSNDSDPKQMMRLVKIKAQTGFVNIYKGDRVVQDDRSNGRLDSTGTVLISFEGRYGFPGREKTAARYGWPQEYVSWIGPEADFWAAVNAEIEAIERAKS